MLRATPPGEDGVEQPSFDDEIENRALAVAGGTSDADDGDDGDDRPSDEDFLRAVSEIESQDLTYQSSNTRRAWIRSYKAFRQQHFDGSKYTSSEFSNRSKMFIPKTRGAVRKDLAATSASLFGSLDSITCLAGNEADAKQRASAALVKELVNYRTDRNSSQVSIPWFHVALGARQTSLLAGVCLSKQSWRLDLARDKKAQPSSDGSGKPAWTIKTNRPDIQLIPPENFIIDMTADWTDPAQSAAFIVIKWPMQIEEIKRRQQHPTDPWRQIEESVLMASTESTKTDASSIRRAREDGSDRLDRTQTGQKFGVVWVYETYIKTGGEDWTFYSIGSKHLLTDPRPVDEVYPEQGGQRPLQLGYGSFEAFSIFPMSPVESWQPLQQEANDIRNLTMDAIKQIVQPVSKVRRGRQVDLLQLKKRAHGTAIMVQDRDDVTWDRPPDIPASVELLRRHLDIDFDELAGQQNYGTVENNNALGRTLGGLKLAAGAANAVQEFDIRIWIETWCEPVLSQVVKLVQFYEDDATILGICGERAGLVQKFGVNEIDDDLISGNVSIRVNVGLGAGDPQQRLSKFNSAVTVAMPLLSLDPKFKSGEKQINADAVMEEVFGAAGYRDGGKRFITSGPPAQNPMQGPELDKLKSETERNRAMAKAAIMRAITDAAKVGLSEQELKMSLIDMLFRHESGTMDQIGRAADLGFSHAERLRSIGNPQQSGAAMAEQPQPSGNATAEPPQNILQQDQGVIQQGAGPQGQLTGVPQGADFAPFSMPQGPAPAAAPGPMPQQFGGGQAQMPQFGAAPKALDPPAPRRRRVQITRRGPDGRAIEFEIVDQ